ncbi:hypothetical protein JVU11DRAFT_8567 [Chiua virens]|nr:hypothetical protein JVU11DRAFT_8567 [Chiua virens]
MHAVDGKPYDAGDIHHVGLCISQVKTFVGHYNVTEAAAKVVGVDKVEAAVIDMIKKTGVQCSYPAHAIPSATPSNACNFVCGNGFSAVPANHPSTCYCPPTMKECNGQCVRYGTDCPVTQPPSPRQNEPKCAEGLIMCGVTDESGQAYKCTNVITDPSTCGGCVKASVFGSPSTTGVNCHAIPNVEQVSCNDSKCIVHTCKDDFTASTSKNACVPNVPEKSTRSLEAGRDDTATTPVQAAAQKLTALSGDKVVRAEPDFWSQQRTRSFAGYCGCRDGGDGTGV